MIHQKAISLLVEECGIPYSSWLAYFPYTGGLTGTFAAYEDYVDAPTDSGDFNSSQSYIRFTGLISGIADYTVIARVAHTGDSDSVIFSTLASGSSLISGVSWGITRNSRLFLEAYSDSGVSTFVTETPLPNTGVISLAKSNNTYSVGLFDPNTQKSAVEDFTFKYTCLTTSLAAPWVGGYLSGAQGFISGGFEGNITDLSVFSGRLRPEEIDRLSLGCLITGASSTGYNAPDIVNVRYNSIAVYDAIDSTDTFSYVLPTGLVHSGANYSASFDSVSSTFSSNMIESSGCNFFVNGVAQVPGTGIITGTYSPMLTSSRDYTATGNSFAGLIRTVDDRGVFDIAISGVSVVEPFSHLGSLEQTVTGASSGAEVFFNGILLSTGDYTASGSSFVFASGNPLYSGSTGVLSIHYFDYTSASKTQQSGKPVSCPSFNTSGSMLYINGVRQNLGEDYEEVSSRDLRNKTGIFPDVSLTFFNDLTFTE